MNSVPHMAPQVHGTTGPWLYGTFQENSSWTVYLCFNVLESIMFKGIGGRGEWGARSAID